MGARAGVRRTTKKRRHALIPYLRELAAGTGDRLPVDSMLLRCSIARQLNDVMGTTQFTAWNINQVPTEDLTEIRMSLQWLQELKRE